MKISVLYLGRLECRKYHLIECDDHNEMIKSPIMSVLIEHPILGNILYDTGNSPYYSTEYPASTLETYPVAEFISIEDALKEKGLTPADIDMIILSHLHFDHAGGLRYFTGTKAMKNVVVSEAEFKNAFCQVMTGKPGAYVIVTSDTIYTCDSYQKELPPGGPINKTKKEFYDNLNRIKAMEKEYSAELLFGHDYDQVLKWKEKGVI